MGYLLNKVFLKSVFMDAKNNQSSTTSQSFPTITYLNEQGILSPSCKHNIPIEVLLKGYKTMVMTRLVDERMITLQRQGSISFALSSLGEEACAVASAAALEFEDWMYPQYRELGVMFWRGCTIEQYIHHMFGDSKDFILGDKCPTTLAPKV